MVIEVLVAWLPIIIVLFFLILYVVFGNRQLFTARGFITFLVSIIIFAAYALWMTYMGPALVEMSLFEGLAWVVGSFIIMLGASAFLTWVLTRNMDESSAGGRRSE